MDADTSLVMGLMLAILSVPALLSAWSDGRLPVIGTLLLAVGGGMVIYAFVITQTGYTLSGLPDVVYTVIGRMLN